MLINIRKGIDMELFIKLFKYYLVACITVGIILMVSALYVVMVFNQDLNEVFMTFSIIGVCTLLSCLMLFVIELMERN